MTKKTHSFSVIGAGSWGTALAVLLARNGHRVALWSREAEHRQAMRAERCNQQYLPDIAFPDSLSIYDDITEMIHHHDHLLIAVPSHAFAAILTAIQPIWPSNNGVIWATKGLDPSTGQFLSIIADEILGKETPKAILTGPSFAKEVATHQPTAVVIAGNSSEFNRTMQTCFQTDYFRTYLSDDMIGAQLGGAVKNVLAIAVGVAEGLGFGTNTKAGLMTRGLAEMIRLGEKLGAKKDTLIGLSGLGDLILTCTDNQSRNRRFGITIGQGQSIEAACKAIGQVVEGVPTTTTVYQVAQKLRVEMPITEQMHLLLTQKTTPKEAVLALTTRTTGHETRSNP